MNEDYKKILEQQLLLLSEKSNDTWSTDELCQLTDKILNLVMFLEPEFQNQSFYAASTGHPYVVQLPAADLVDLYAARAELLHRRVPSHKS